MQVLYFNVGRRGVTFLNFPSLLIWVNMVGLFIIDWVQDKFLLLRLHMIIIGLFFVVFIFRLQMRRATEVWWLNIILYHWWLIWRFLWPIQCAFGSVRNFFQQLLFSTVLHILEIIPGCFGNVILGDIVTPLWRRPGGRFLIQFTIVARSICII